MFKLCESSYSQTFFNKYSQPSVSRDSILQYHGLQIQYSWDAKPRDLEGQLYLHRGSTELTVELECVDFGIHGGPETNPIG